jgi:hypothetical protein
MDEYHGKILKFERNILLKPKMKTVRNRMSFPYSIQPTY